MKKKFLQSKEWKTFRKKEIAKRNSICDLCGRPIKKGATLHHLDPDNYYDLNPDKFLLVHRKCHTLTEYILTKPEIINNIWRLYE